jgi:flagellar capping protein FliD
MQQQVNLYQPISTGNEEPFSANILLSLVAMTVVLMMIFYGSLYWNSLTMQREISTRKSQFEQTKASVEKLEQTVASLSNSKKEQQQLAHLKRVFASKQQALKDLSTMVRGNDIGLSDYFAALARKNIDPIWFDNINVYAGGQQMILKGQSTDAKAIPGFVASLKKEVVFNGISFKVFNVTKNDKEKSAGKVLDFVMQTEALESH